MPELAGVVRVARFGVERGTGCGEAPDCRRAFFSGLADRSLRNSECALDSGQADRDRIAGTSGELARADGLDDKRPALGQHQSIWILPADGERALSLRPDIVFIPGDLFDGTRPTSIGWQHRSKSLPRGSASTSLLGITRSLREQSTILQPSGGPACGC